MKEYRRLDQIRPNPDNPRTITKGKFRKLVNSVRDFSGMLEARPLVVDTNGVILGGNMRYEAARELKLDQVPVIVVDWTPEEKERFVIADNVNFGSWDWEVLANEWNPERLLDWGLDLWQPDDKEEDPAPVCECCGK